MRMLLGALLLCTAGAANADWTYLEGRDLTGDGVADAFYDPGQNLTWLRDTDYQKTIGFEHRTYNFKTDYGLYTDEAFNFVAGLNVGGTTGWRLAHGILPPGLPFPNATQLVSSELNNLYTALGGDLSMFSNVLGAYWIDLGTTGPGGGYAVWGTAFRPDSPGTYENENVTPFGAWAVHDGDIGVAAPIPEPSTYALMAIGLAAIGFVAWRRRAP